MNEASKDNVLGQAHPAVVTEEKALFTRLARIILPEMVVIDVGAGTGQFTFNLNRVITRCSIYAVEADPLQFSQLKDNCVEWEKNSDNCIYAFQAAVSDKEQKSLPTADDREATLTSYKLDSLFKIIAPDFIEIKADGSEFKILKGSSSILRKGEAKFLIEFAKETQSSGKTSSAEIDVLMKSFGYYFQDFNGCKLFTNPSKNLGYAAKRLYRQMLPETLRRWIKKRE